ncbi:MAG: HK97 family phage prohead protease [Candidatus Woesearchaeota archaeon]
MTNNKEIIRAYFDEETQKKYISGYAVVFEQLSKRILENGKLFYEKILRNSLENTDLSNVIMCLNHDKNQMLARTKSETLELNIDDYGLFYRFEVPNTNLGNDIYEQVSRGDYKENSFAYMLDEKNRNDVEYIKDKEYGLIRIVKNIRKITDCSIVRDGAYNQTYIFLERNLKDIESDLNDNNDYQIKNNKRKELEIIKLKN